MSGFFHTGGQVWAWALRPYIPGMAAALMLVLLGLIFIIWAGYPLALYFLLRRGWRDRPDTFTPPGADRLPTVSLIIAAHNEAAAIAGKVANVLALAYPRDKLEIILADDGSTDATAALAAQAGAGRVRILKLPRGGKAQALNAAAAVAAGEILAFSDASNLYTPATLQAWMRPFADPRVGGVVGRKGMAARLGMGCGEGIYWRYENILLALESRTGTVTSGSGEVLALRRELYRPLPTAGMINDDLFQVLQLVAQGRRVAFASDAYSWELPAPSSRAEWERRSRMSAGRQGALRVLAPELRRLPWPVRAKIAIHVSGGGLTALWMLLALALAFPVLGLALHHALPMWLGMVAGLQFAFYFCAMVGGGLRGLMPAAQAPYYFCLAQAACLNGILRQMRGKQSAAWHPTPRPQAEPEVAAAVPGSPRKVVQGVAWAFSSFTLGKFLIFGATMVLARILVPAQFGEVAVVLSALSFLEILGSLGIASAIIYEPEAPREAADVGFWLMLPAAALTIALAWPAAPVIANFFHVPATGPMLRLLSFSLLATAFSTGPDALLRRELDFRRKLRPDLAQAILKGASSVLLAWAGWGAWSLIWGQLIGATTYAAMLWWVTGWRPQRQWSPAIARRMLAYARHIYLMEVVGTLLFNLDTLTVGRLLGPVALGYYALAYRIPDLVLMNLVNLFSRVLFPAFSRMRSDWNMMRQALLGALRHSALITLPLATGMLVAARALILTAYGARWEPAIRLFQVLLLYVIVRCISHHFGDVYKAIGRPDILSRFLLVWAVVLPACLVLGAHVDGLLGVAFGLLAARIIMTGLHCVVMLRILSVRPRQLAAALRPALETSAAVGGAAATAAWAAPVWPLHALLILQAGASALAYAGWLYIRQRETLIRLAGLLVPSFFPSPAADLSLAVEGPGHAAPDANSAAVPKSKFQRRFPQPVEPEPVAISPREPAPAPAEEHAA